MDITKKRLFFLLRLILGLSILYIALVQVQWNNVVEIITKIEFLPILLIYIILIIIAVITAIRFKIIVSEPSKQIPFKFALHITFLSCFLNIVMPAKSGIRRMRTRASLKPAPTMGIRTGRVTVCRGVWGSDASRGHRFMDSGFRRNDEASIQTR